MDGSGALALKKPVTYDRSNRNSSPKPEYHTRRAPVSRDAPGMRAADGLPEAVPGPDIDIVAADRQRTDAQAFDVC